VPVNHADCQGCRVWHRCPLFGERDCPPVSSSRLVCAAGHSVCSISTSFSHGQKNELATCFDLCHVDMLANLCSTWYGILNDAGTSQLVSRPAYRAHCSAWSPQLVKADGGHCSALGRCQPHRGVLWPLHALGTPVLVCSSPPLPACGMSENSLPQVWKPALIKQTNKQKNCPVSFPSRLWSQRLMAVATARQAGRAAELPGASMGKRWGPQS